MSMIHMVTRADGRILARIGPNATHWGDRTLHECVNFRYAIQFPTAGGARKAASMHGGAVASAVQP